MKRKRVGSAAFLGEEGNTKVHLYLFLQGETVYMC